MSLKAGNGRLSCGTLTSRNDDVSLWFEIDPTQDLNQVIQTINEDLARLKLWGDDNHTTFEKSKMEMLLVSQKHRPFKLKDVVFDGFDLPSKPCIKLVGYSIDSKLRWGDMVDRIAKKARIRLAALRRVQSFVDSHNLELIYTTFIRPITEYGSIA